MIDGSWMGQGFDDNDLNLYVKGGRFVLYERRDTNHSQHIWWRRGQLLRDGVRVVLWVTEHRRAYVHDNYIACDEVFKATLHTTDANGPRTTSCNLEVDELGYLGFEPGGGFQPEEQLVG